MRARGGGRGYKAATPSAVTDLRVIAGKYKGTKLVSPLSSATHPMGAREKNALFNMLQPWLAGATVLDAYAGSGALGIEALSRGAANVVFVEASPAVAQVLRENLERVPGLGRASGFNGVSAEVEVVADTVAAAMTRPEWQGKFDLIIADPPYDDFRVTEIAQLSRLLAPGGILALSYPGDLGELDLAGFARLNARHYAAAGIGIYQQK